MLATNRLKDGYRTHFLCIINRGGSCSTPTQSYVEIAMRFMDIGGKEE